MSGKKTADFFKYSLDDLTRFILIGQKGEEKIIFTPGDMFEESITYGQGKVFWIESKKDIRWAHRDFSQLRILNISDGTVVEKKISGQGLCTMFVGEWQISCSCKSKCPK